MGKLFQVLIWWEWRWLFTFPLQIS